MLDPQQHHTFLCLNLKCQWGSVCSVYGRCHFWSIAVLLPCAVLQGAAPLLVRMRHPALCTGLSWAALYRDVEYRGQVVCCLTVSFLNAERAMYGLWMQRSYWTWPALEQRTDVRSR